MNRIISPALLLIVLCVSVNLPMYTSEPSNKHTAVIVGAAATGATVIAAGAYLRRHADYFWESGTAREIANGGVLPLWPRALKWICRKLRPNAPMRVVQANKNASLPLVLSALRDSRPLTDDDKQIVEAKVRACLKSEWESESNTSLYDSNVKLILDANPDLLNDIKKIAPFLTRYWYCRVERKNLAQTREDCLVYCVAQDSKAQRNLCAFVRDSTQLSLKKKDAYVLAALSLCSTVGEDMVEGMLPVHQIEQDEQLLRICSNSGSFLGTLLSKNGPLRDRFRVRSKNFWDQLFAVHSVVFSDLGSSILSAFLRDGMDSNFLAAIPSEQMREVMSVKKVVGIDDRVDLNFSLRKAWIDFKVGSPEPFDGYYSMTACIQDVQEKAGARLRYWITHQGDKYDGMKEDIDLMKEVRILDGRPLDPLYRDVCEELFRRGDIETVDRFSKQGCAEIFQQLAEYILYKRSNNPEFLLAVLSKIPMKEDLHALVRRYCSMDIQISFGMQRYLLMYSGGMAKMLNDYDFTGLYTVLSTPGEKNLDEDALFTLIEICKIRCVEDCNTLLERLKRVLGRTKSVSIESLSPKCLHSLLTRFSVYNRTSEELCREHIGKLLGCQAITDADMATLLFRYGVYRGGNCLTKSELLDAAVEAACRDNLCLRMEKILTIIESQLNGYGVECKQLMLQYRTRLSALKEGPAERS